MNMGIARTLELHYFFNDDSHSMDAIVRNKCEREILAIIQECALTLGIDVHIEAEAYAEGGLKELWKILGTPQVATLLVIITIILSRSPPGDPQKQVLDIELTKLSIEEKKLSVERLKNELVDNKEGQNANKALEDVVSVLNDNPKVVVPRSSLYEQMLQCGKITKISVSAFNDSNKLVGEEREVHRNGFYKFILTSRTLQPLTVDDAEIAIVSPVLREGNYKWKGIYNDEPITFSMNDEQFRYSVRSKEVTFQNGSVIICVLEVHRKLDETGSVVVTGYSVPTVIKKEDSAQIIETSQGRQHKQDKRLSQSQGNMFAN